MLWSILKRKNMQTLQSEFQAMLLSLLTFQENSSLMLLHVPAMTEFKGIVHSFESFGSVDGPGIRCVVFMQGCRMRCKYCHNPDTWSVEGAEEYTPQQLLDKVWKYNTYWGKNSEKGGVTVSGGEPLLQIEFVAEFFRLLKEKGVHTALDTSGQPFSEEEEFLKKFDELLKYTDLVLLDLKHMDRQSHKQLTGFDNENILKMAQYLSDKGVPMWIRRVLVPGYTDNEEELKKLSQFAKSLKTVEKVEILPYHTLGLFKWEKLGITYPLEGVPSPTKEQTEKVREILK